MPSTSSRVLNTLNRAFDKVNDVLNRHEIVLQLTNQQHISELQQTALLLVQADDTSTQRSARLIRWSRLPCVRISGVVRLPSHVSTPNDGQQQRGMSQLEAAAASAPPFVPKSAEQSLDRSIVRAAGPVAVMPPSTFPNQPQQQPKCSQVYGAAMSAPIQGAPQFYPPIMQGSIQCGQPQQSYQTPAQPVALGASYYGIQASYNGTPGYFQPFQPTSQVTYNNPSLQKTYNISS